MRSSPGYAMRDAQPSRTAMRVAARRAVHQLLDVPRVLEDPIALPILGAETAGVLKAAPLKHQSRVAKAFRAFMVVRSRFAEDELARSIGRGVTQYVVLGAGLDTFAYRNPHRGLRVFEVDHPATQQWKRRKLAAAAIPIPPTVTYAPVDFERQTLAEGLAAAGFDRGSPAFFSWLGVTMYLTDEAIRSTLELVGSTARGGGLVFDYGVARSALGWTERFALASLSRRVAAAGEPFRTLFEPAALRGLLEGCGLHSIRDLGRDELNQRYFEHRADGLRVRGGLGRLISAEV